MTTTTPKPHPHPFSDWTPKPIECLLETRSGSVLIESGRPDVLATLARLEGGRLIGICWSGRMLADDSNQQ